MFEDENNLNQHQDPIMGATRSIVVCLHILLKLKNQELFANIFQEYLQPELYSVVGSTRDLAGSSNIEVSNNFIIDNLSDLLFEEQYSEFREKLIVTLMENSMHEEALIFDERLSLARSLPASTKSITSSLIANLKNSRNHFLDWLFNNINELENAYTKTAMLDLLFNVFPGQSTSEANITPDPVVGYASIHDDAMYTPLYKELLTQSRDLHSRSNMDYLIKMIQMLNSGLLVYNEPEFVWKFKNDLDLNAMGLVNFKKILKLTEVYEKNTSDFSERLSLLLTFNPDPIVLNFVEKLLNKLPVTQAKLQNQNNQIGTKYQLG